MQVKTCWPSRVIRSFASGALALMLSPQLLQAATTAPQPRTASAEIIGTALRSTDLDRSIKFYTAGLGMVVARTLELGAITEVIFSYGSGAQPPVILIYKNNVPEQSPPIDLGNGYGRIMLRVTDASALAEKLAAAGYTVGEVRKNPVNSMKVFWVNDPDGYRIEVTEFAPKK